MNNSSFYSEVIEEKLVLFVDFGIYSRTIKDTAMWFAPIDTYRWVGTGEQILASHFQKCLSYCLQVGTVFRMARDGVGQEWANYGWRAAKDFVRPSKY